MRKKITGLINTIISEGKDKGFSQKEIAQEGGGITPEWLSRSKRRGDISAVALLRMADFVGLELTLKHKDRTKAARLKGSQAVQQGRLFKIGEQDA
ncbi:MAG: hypothetical protein HON68_01930 [Gammaproteobacteria bacterium]|jgi:hypothetical protein|nr:hypothetical protein [Gammaproteobacteria bacterium]MBT3718388.1 hypothetical protein [Gammaproteobacteria bacterium]MBT3846099.1 hypothetical protein [Gammaproteobacteria bacterium]MBT3893748.1 hypothetical protein [Gammaproteobacteria bacterium]MBT4301607.1 hypothetical protein [Gammaproteobacteria bacterium]